MPTTLPRRKPGRPKTGKVTLPFTVMLPPALHEWAMRHPEGFSGLTRRLLTEVQQGQSHEPGLAS